MLSNAQIEECLLAILDATMDTSKGVVHHEVLEADGNGYTPDQCREQPGKPGYNPTSPNSIEIVAKKDMEVRLIVIDFAWEV